VDASTAGVIATVAAGVAIVALAISVRLAFALRRLRAGQQAVLGSHGEQDLVSYTQGLAEAFDSLQLYVERTSAGIDQRLDGAERRLDATISYAGLVRYDALNEMSGHQSTSIALLDTHRSGIVLTSIHHRDQARLYAKLVHDGRGELELSPEEADAIRQALEGSPSSPGEASTA
jgi:hypothetical protein